MKRVALSLALFALFLFVGGCRAAEDKPVDEAAIKRNVDETVEAIKQERGFRDTGLVADLQGLPRVVLGRWEEE